MITTKMYHLGSTLLNIRTFCSKTKPVLTLYTKEVCPLCDEAKHELRHLLPRVELQMIDIEKDKQLFKKYRYDIPVFHLNGKFIFKHRANPKLLEKELDKLDS